MKLYDEMDGEQIVAKSCASVMQELGFDEHGRQTFLGLPVVKVVTRSGHFYSLQKGADERSLANASIIEKPNREGVSSLRLTGVDCYDCRVDTSPINAMWLADGRKVTIDIAPSQPAHVSFPKTDLAERKGVRTLGL